MTDNNKIQANSVDNNKIQASLTEQWKKGKLPEGHYYVKDGGNMIAEYLDGYFYNNGVPMTSFSGGVDEVLAEVPDYVEWRNMVNCACEEHEANHRLLEENAQLKEKIERLEKQLEIADSYLQVIVGLKGGKCFQCVDFAKRARKKIKELEK